MKILWLKETTGQEGSGDWTTTYTCHNTIDTYTHINADATCERRLGEVVCHVVLLVATL